ncbi:MAG: hypothetical protein IMW84_08905 [Thermoanaerobacter sp.]|nr:hypothetical protein [Thermoanaerobacter sp.]
MKDTSRYGRDYQYYKDYERLYGSYDITKLVTLKKLVEASEYEEWKDYKEFKEWCNSEERHNWKNSPKYIEWEKKKLL